MGKEYKSLDEVVKALEELKARFPAHSLKPAMMQELEDLEELLSRFDYQGDSTDDSLPNN